MLFQSSSLFPLIILESPLFVILLVFVVATFLLVLARKQIWASQVTKEEKRILEEKETEEEYELTVKKLTFLFHKGEISEKSFKTAIKSLEEKRAGLQGESPGRKGYDLHRRKPTALWWLVPLFFGIIGGIVGYIAVRDDDSDMAYGLLIFGIVITAIAWLFLQSFVNFFLHMLVTFLSANVQ